MLRMIRMLRIGSMWQYSSCRQSLFLFGCFVGEVRLAIWSFPSGSSKKSQPWCYES